jgi:hypothetical protein
MHIDNHMQQLYIPNHQDWRDWDYIDALLGSDADNGKDGGVLFDDTSVIPHPPPIELSLQMLQPATKSFAAKLSWKSINLISFH